MTVSIHDAHIGGFVHLPIIQVTLKSHLRDILHYSQLKMALPALQVFENCAEWNKTIEPYLPQLYELPAKLLDVLQSRQGFVELYTQTNPLISGLAFSIVLGFIFLVVSEINQNFSQVDRCWSILPTFYVAHFDLWARLSGIDSSRIDTILLFCTAWTVSRGTHHPSRQDGITDFSYLGPFDLQLLAERWLHCRI